MKYNTSTIQWCALLIVVFPFTWKLSKMLSVDIIAAPKEGGGGTRTLNPEGRYNARKYGEFRQCNHLPLKMVYLVKITLGD